MYNTAEFIIFLHLAYHTETRTRMEPRGTCNDMILLRQRVHVQLFLFVISHSRNLPSHHYIIFPQQHQSIDCLLLIHRGMGSAST